MLHLWDVLQLCSKHTQTSDVYYDQTIFKKSSFCHYDSQQIFVLITKSHFIAALLC